MGNICECLHSSNKLTDIKNRKRAQTEEESDLFSKQIDVHKRRISRPDLGRPIHNNTTDQITQDDNQTTVNDKNRIIVELKKEILSPKITMQDFTIISSLGHGSFGEVFLLKRKKDGKELALKKIKKSDIEKTSINSLINEKNILVQAKHPFVLRILFCFQDTSNVYLGMDYMEGGDLFKYLQFYRKFSENTAKFILAQVILGLEYLHNSLNVIYRDLKPENLLLDHDGNIKICDFGLSTIGLEKSYSFCGTKEYLAPEIVEKIGHTKNVDFWGLGCLVYELLAGTPPFRSENKVQLFHLISSVEYVMPSYFSQEAKNLIRSLLKKIPEERLGACGFSQLKEDQFFSSINWDKIYNKEIKSPIPIRKGQLLTANQVQLNCQPENSYKYYNGFTYIGEDNTLNNNNFNLPEKSKQHCYSL